MRYHYKPNDCNKKDLKQPVLRRMWRNKLSDFAGRAVKCYRYCAIVWQFPKKAKHQLTI